MFAPLVVCGLRDHYNISCILCAGPVQLWRWASIKTTIILFNVLCLPEALPVIWIIFKCPLTTLWVKDGGPRVVFSTAAFHARARGSVPGLGGLKRTKMFLPHPRVITQYCGEPPWPRGSVLGLRPPGLEFRILCLEDSVISFISPFSGGSPGSV